MKQFNKILVLFVLLSTLSVDNTYSQSFVERVVGAESNGYNPLSLRQVHESYLMWKKTLWRRVDLKEKQNKPFFAINREISKIIFEAVQRGVLIPYNSDSVTDNNVMAREDFLINVQQEDLDGGDDDFGGGFEDDPFAAAADPFADEVEEEESAGPQLIPNREFSIFEIREDLYFDRVHSRIYFDIQSITMYLPGDSFFNLTGIEKPIASFRFIDLYNLFKSMPKEAIWFNENNIAQHKNLADAFLLRLFKGIIVKIANADDIRVSELFSKSRKDGIMASFKVEQDLIEWEANLWEY